MWRGFEPGYGGGGEVACFAQKMKDKYNERIARVTGLNAKHIKVTMFDGPAKGEKRKFAYKQ
eukprot:3426105-Lingulodinium_polyedra.AAC.1